jgi:hypothetical protein
MKAIFYSIISIVSLCSLSTFGHATCPNGGGVVPNNGQSPYINDPAGPYGVPVNDYLNSGGTAAGVSPLGRLTTSSNPNLATPAATVAPATPSARITVLPADASPSARVTPKTLTATLTIVADDPVVSTTPKVTPTLEPKLDDRIAKLVGIWKAVARRGNGELTTVELHLDNRGWAELTVPDNDGKPNTTKSRVDFENDELKLKGDDKVVSLGKLVESTSRQMVLERAEGRVTFVRL